MRWTEHLYSNSNLKPHCVIVCDFRYIKTKYVMADFNFGCTGETLVHKNKRKKYHIWMLNQVITSSILDSYVCRKSSWE
jgi:hypothetical protein